MDNNNDNFDLLKHCEEIEGNQAKQENAPEEIIEEVIEEIIIETDNTKGFSENQDSHNCACDSHSHTPPVIPFKGDSNYQDVSSDSSNIIKVDIPNAKTILILGISSIVACCCCSGLLSPILSIIALVLYGTAKRKYLDDPSLYKDKSYQNLNTGKICAIIGLAIGVLFIIWITINFANGDFSEIEKALKEIERTRY